MLKRITNWVKSLFHEETPEEQDERIHKTIKTWRDNVDKLELERIDAYYDICYDECRTLHRLIYVSAEVIPSEVSLHHLELWNEPFPRIENKEDNALKALTKWHDAHLWLAAMYCYDVTDPPDGSLGRFNKHVDLRPAKWLKDLVNEEKIIKALRIKENAKEYQV